MVYPVTNTGAQATVSALEEWIYSFGLPQSIEQDRGTAFFNTDFINWIKVLGKTLRPRTAHPPWTKGKSETQNQHIDRYWRIFLNDAENNWSTLAPKFAFAHNTSVNYITGEATYEIVFGTEPQILSLRNSDSTAKNINFAVLISAKTYNLIQIVRTILKVRW